MGLVRTETTRINGITYTASTMPAARSIYVLTRLTALLGEGVVAIFMTAMGMALGEKDNSEAISTAVGELFSDPRVMSKMLIMRRALMLLLMRIVCVPVADVVMLLALCCGCVVVSVVA